jgi:hypothetical protein
MPFKSQAQWKKFGELLKQGKISQSTFDDFAGASKAFADLPVRVGKPPKAAPASRRRTR